MRPTSPQLTNPSPVDKFRDSNTRTQGEDYGVEPTATSNSYIQQPRRSGTYNSGCNSSAHEMMLPTRRALYRPHGSPDHRGSGSYSPTQQGIPTHRYGGPGNSYSEDPSQRRLRFKLDGLVTAEAQPHIRRLSNRWLSITGMIIHGHLTCRDSFGDISHISSNPPSTDT